MFCKAILNDEPIDIYNHGDMQRGFTYIDDIVNGVIKVMEKPATHDVKLRNSASAPNSLAPYRIFNIGNSKPHKLLTYIEFLEEALGKEAKKNYMDIQLGDVKSTCADTLKLQEWINFQPTKDLKSGIYEFVKWYKDYYK
jgi:UDP-glucuronate 4-epimerase